MGCDIHLHAEIKVGGKWLHYDQPDCDRNYGLFERMAGVRGEDENAIAPPRGLPSDISDTTRFEADRWEGDGHSHSWLGATEIKELADWYRNEFPDDKDNIWPKWDRWLCGNCYSDFVRYPDSKPKGVEDVRFVFWFDN